MVRRFAAAAALLIAAVGAALTGGVDAEPVFGPVAPTALTVQFEA